MESIILQIVKLWDASFFSKYSELDEDFRNAILILENISDFLDSCIWIGCVKFSLVWREYISSAMKLLGETFSNLIYLKMMKQLDETAALHISGVFRRR